MFLKIIRTTSFIIECEREMYLDFLRKSQIMSFTFLQYTVFTLVRSGTVGRAVD